MNKTILVTGATGTIGKATAIALAKRGVSQLVLAGRNAARLGEVKAAVEAAGSGVRVDTLLLELSDPASVRGAVETIKARHPQLDGLVHAAAVYKTTRLLTGEQRELMFATNHLGPFQLTTGLLELLKATPGAKVLTVSAPSTTKVDFENLNGEKRFSAFTAFGSSKMMNLLFAFQLARRLEGSGQASMAYHPGMVKSELLNEAPALLRGFIRLISSPPEKTAAAIADLLLQGDAHAQNGKFFDSKKKELKADAFATDAGHQQRLWQVSEDLMRQ